MSFRDEEFIRLMNRGKASVTGDLAHGIFFREERMNFQEKKLLGEKLFVSLPEDFDEMSEENACMRYPMPQRPQIIMTNETEDKIFGFSLIECETDNLEVPARAQFFKNTIMNARADISIMEENELSIEGKTIAWFDYVSSGLGQEIYNMMYFASIDNKLLHGIFHCDIQEAENWKKIVHEVMKSIREES